jgi:hypothetical protein
MQSLWLVLAVPEWPVSVRATYLLFGGKLASQQAHALLLLQSHRSHWGAVTVAAHKLEHALHGISQLLALHLGRGSKLRSVVSSPGW